jgi:hypothetical protein
LIFIGVLPANVAISASFIYAETMVREAETALQHGRDGEALDMDRASASAIISL